MLKSLCCAVFGILSCASFVADVAEAADNEPLSVEIFNGRSLPCPTGWTVSPNLSLDDSLSYETEDHALAVSVSLIKQGNSGPLNPESYARVAAEQMGCTIPVHSNLIDDGWSFECHDFKVESIVYGGHGDLVLLGISGRNSRTERQLNEFIRFLAYQAEAD